MVKGTVRVLGLAAVASVALAACGSKPASTSSSSTTSGGAAASSSSSGAAAGGQSLNACMVLDVGGVDDRSFNQSSWKGMQDAQAANPNVKISYVPSSSQNDYTPNLNAQVSKGCRTTIAVGGLMTDALKAVAAKNPDKKFAIIDSNTGQPNVYGLQFNTAQGGFLGGYLAAGYSKTGKVATWGGLNIPPVTVYMDGFWEGVQYYNKQKSKNVQVLGWNEQNQKAGTFAQSFTDKNKGQQISQQFIQQGADVIFPVAGGAGEGAGQAALASGGKVSVMWVDTDGCESVPAQCSVFVSSVVKNLAKAVTTYVTAAASGSFPTGSYVGTLQNDGTGLAPFHQFDSKVPAGLKSELDTVKQDIISGKIKITSPSQPK
jgi:basic membrane protein A and related proteins